MSEIDEKLVALIGLVHRKTKNSELKWKSPYIEEGYEFKSANFVIRVSQETVSASNYGGASEIEITTLSILNSSDNVVDQTDTQLLRSADEYGAADMLGEVYNSARRYASGADEAISRILEDLNDIPF